MKKFKADRETGITIATNDGVHIRLDAGQEYATDDPREIEILSGTAGVVEVKDKRAKAKD